MKITIGTTSELKIRALNKALKNLKIKANIISKKAKSGVNDQPFGYSEITLGAKNRALNSIEKDDPDLSLGIENGLIEIENNYFDIACIYVISSAGDESISYSAGYFTPKWIIDEIKSKHTEFGHITQRISGDSEKDPLRYFSKTLLTREEILVQAIEIALIKIFFKERYSKK